MSDENIPILNSQEAMTSPKLKVQCVDCKNDIIYEIQSLAVVNKTGFSMIVITHEKFPECPFCKRTYVPTIQFSIPPVNLMPLPRPNNIVSPFSKQ